MRNYLKGNLFAALFTVFLFWSYNAAFYWIEPFVRSGWRLNELIPVDSGIWAVIRDLLIGPVALLLMAIVPIAVYLLPVILVSTLLEGIFGLMTTLRRPIPFVITVVVLASIGVAWGFIDRVHTGNMPVSF